MVDEKEELINTICSGMNLEHEEDLKLRNLLWMNLYPFSLVRIGETDIVVRDETLNEQVLRMFLLPRVCRDAPKEH